MLNVIDYGAGNIKSVANALAFFGCDFRLVADPDKVQGCDGIVLPGVGAFGAAMDALRARGMDEALRGAVRAGVPLLGICLGQQLLFESSEESPSARGLGILKGRVTRLKAEGKKIPHIGWTSIESPKGRLLQGIREGDFFYFVHSFGVHAADEEAVSGRATYGEGFDAAVEKDNVFGVQFHPEKSGEKGLKIIGNFINLCKEGA